MSIQIPLLGILNPQISIFIFKGVEPYQRQILL